MPVRVEVAPGGRLLIDGAFPEAGTVIECWNHDPDSVREALAQSGGYGEWDSRWHVLRVPVRKEGGLRAIRLINLARPEDAAGCR